MIVRARADIWTAFFGALLVAQLAAAAAPLNATALAALNSTLSGYAVSTAQDPSYDVSYLTWNNLQQGVHPVLPHSEPAFYLKAADVADVLVGLEFAIKNGLKTSFLANGHQFGDTSLLSGGMTIDVQELHDATVYPGNKTAYFQPGWTGGDFGNLTAQYGLYFPVAHASGVGISGFTLGGGFGWGSSLIGAAVDNVISYDVVNTWDFNKTDKLEVVSVSATSYPDLYWGLRGAGQNLAAVVGFHVQLHDLPAHTLVPFVVGIFPLPLAFKAYDQWLQWKETAPTTLEATIILSPLGPGEYGLVTAVYNFDPTGQDQAALAAMEDWAARANATGAVQVISTVIPYDALLTSQDMSQDYPGVASYIYSPFTEPGAITVDIFAELVMLYANVSGPESIILISDSNENVGITNSDTAFGSRNQTFVWVWGMWTRTAGGAAVDGDADHIAWVQQSKSILGPLQTGQYINMVQFTSPNDTQNSYPADNWSRVKAVKAKYDARNLFRDLAYYRPKMGNSIDYSTQDVDGGVTF